MTENGIIIFIFLVMAIQMAAFGLYLRLSGLSIKGKPPISPFRFRIAKLLMFVSWFSVLAQGAGWINLSWIQVPSLMRGAALFLLAAGASIQLAAYFQLGKNIKFGIPDQNDQRFSTLAVKGLYRFSRNPMYTGFFLIMLSGCVYVFNPLIWLSAAVSLYLHHQIVLKEEVFLQERFGSGWDKYKAQVRRYI